MKMREPWKKQMKQITNNFSDLTALINTNDIACADIDMSTLGDKVNTLQDLIPTRIASIEEADRKQGLFSDRSTKPYQQQIPSYSGTRSEDFITFNDKFTKAAKDNRISKTDQLEKPSTQPLSLDTDPSITRPAQVTNMATLASLRNSLRNRIHNIEVLLGTMTTPVRSPTQEIEHNGYVKMINKMTFEANGNFLDIKTTLKP